MITYTEAVRTLSHLKYKGRLNFWKFKQVDQDSEAYELWVSIDVVDRDSNEPTTLWDKVVLQPVDMEIYTRHTLVCKVREHIRILELHEIDESITYNGTRIFDPHKEVVPKDHSDVD